MPRRRAVENPLTEQEAASSSQGASTVETPISTTSAGARPTYEGLKLTYASPRLNKKNYVDWAAKIEILLDIQGIWTIVNGTEMQPNDKSTAETIKNWKQRNSIALAILGGSIEETEYCTIRSIRNAADAWTKLRDMHRPDGEQAYYRLMARIMKLRGEGSSSIQEALQKLEDLWNELEDVQ